MKRICWVGIGLLAAVGLAGCEQAQSQTPGAAPAPPPQEVFYALPKQVTVTDFEDFTGHTAAIQTVTVRPRVSGYLDSVDFEDGAEVAAGQTLFEIDDRPYVDDRDNKAALVAQGKQHLQRLKSDFDRAQTMLSSKAISQEQYDQYRYDYLEQMASLKAAEASLALSELNVGYTKVKAQIAGKVSSRLVDAHNLVVADVTPLVTIVSEDPMYGYFDVDEHTVLTLRRLIQQGKLKKEDNLTVKLALTDETDFPHEGTINFIDNQVDAQTGTLRFRGTFKNPPTTPKTISPPRNPTDITPTAPHQAAERMLTPGLFIRVRMYIGAPHDALVIPEVALATDQGRKYVYVINAKNEAIYTPVEIGAPYPDEMRVIESGLNTADRVVVSGLQRVRNKAVVLPKEFRPPAEKAPAASLPATSAPVATAPSNPQPPAAK